MKLCDVQGNNVELVTWNNSNYSAARTGSIVLLE